MSKKFLIENNINNIVTYKKLSLAGLKTPEYNFVNNWEDIKKSIIVYI